MNGFRLLLLYLSSLMVYGCGSDPDESVGKGIVSEPGDSTEIEEDEAEDYYFRGANVPFGVVAFMTDGWKCQGAVVSANVILTAGHCLKKQRWPIAISEYSKMLNPGWKEANADGDVYQLFDDRETDDGRIIIDIGAIVFPKNAFKSEAILPISKKKLQEGDRYYTIATKGRWLTRTDEQTVDWVEYGLDPDLLNTVFMTFSHRQFLFKGDSGGPALDTSTDEVVGVFFGYGDPVNDRGKRHGFTHFHNPKVEKFFNRLRGVGAQGIPKL